MRVTNKLAIQLLSKAKDDLEYAQVGFKETDLYANICFSCQQAFEKSLKSFLTAHGVDFPKAHDLTKLLSLCIEIDPNFSQFEEAAAIITPYSVVTRYPDISDITFSKYQAAQALKFAKSLQDFVEGRLD